MRALLLALMFSVIWSASAQEVYPNKPVRVVVVVGTGGSSDISARLISQQLSEQLGQSFVVENRPGAGGAVGLEFAAKSKPDGYTLLLLDTNAVVLPSLRKTLPFDVIRDFDEIAGVVNIPSVLVVNPASGIKTFDEFLNHVRANPGQWNYGSAGIGSSGQLAAELMKSAAKVDVKHIPYKGGGEMISALLGNHVQMLLISVPSVLEQIKAGKLRALAVTTEGKRLAALPEVPSMRELGLSNMVFYNWYGLAAPSGTPKEVVSKLHSEVIKAMAVPAVRDRFTAQGAELVGSTPAEFEAYVRSEVQRWSQIMGNAGIKAE